MDLTITDSLSDWESLISTVDKFDIPLEFVDGINLLFSVPEDGKDSLLIDVSKYKAIGYSDDLIEDIVNETLNEYYTNIRTMDFDLNIAHVARTVQKETKRMLKGL